MGPARKPLLTAVILLVLTSTLAGDELWNLAVSHYESYRDLLPGTMSINFDQFNGRGRLVSSEYREIEITVGNDGEIESRTILAIKDGKEVTPEDGEPPASDPPFGGGGGDGDSPFAGLALSPFDPEEQQRVTVTDTGRTEWIDGSRTRVVRYRHATSEKGSTTGTIWLDEETGAPLRLVAGIDPLPGYVDEFEMVQAFETDSDGRWYLTHLEFIGEGHILFVKRRIESAFVFDDYFLPPAGTVN